MEGEEQPISSFNSLPIYGCLKSSLTAMGINKPTLIQQHTLLPALKGRDIIGAAPTGSGKTLCFAIPILQSLASDPYGIHSLILTPTRELALQIGDQFRALGAKISVRNIYPDLCLTYFLKIRVEVLVGGLDQLDQTTKLQQIPHVVVATPGRLLYLLLDNTCPGFNLKRIKFLILDEADLLLSKNFQEQIGGIFTHLPKKRQTMLFSATITPNLKRLTEVALTNPYFHNLSQKSLYDIPEGLVQEYCLVSPTVKDCYLYYLLKKFSSLPSIIVFVATKLECETLYLMLKDLQLGVTQIHSLMLQEKRLNSIVSFKSGLFPILVATTVASRGLDIPTVGLVINYNIPRTTEDYVHQVGRTARAGRGGLTITLVTQHEVDALLTIEEQTNSKMTEHVHNEIQVLKNINNVLKAKQVALLYLEDNGFSEKVRKRRENKRIDVMKEKSEKNKTNKKRKRSLEEQDIKK